MKNVVVMLTAFVASNFAFAGELPFPPPKVATVCPEGCSALKPECPAGCTPVPKVKPKPAPKPAPKPVEPKKEDCKPVERVVEKTKYVDREVSVFKKNHAYFLLGRGVGGMVTDHYNTRDRDGEFAVRSGQMGLVFTGLYARSLNDTWSIIGGVSSTLPKPSGMLGFGVDW